MYGFLEILKIFVKNAVDYLCKTGYDVIRKIIGYHVELLEQTWLTWYRKGELDHTQEITVNNESRSARKTGVLLSRKQMS